MALQSDQDWQLTKKTVLERISHLFNNPTMSDIKFTCGESKEKYFYAHKFVLAASSPVFYAMFYGDLAEKNSVIHLPDTDEESLEAFLRFLYTEENPATLELALKMIYLAKKYMIVALAERCWELVDIELSKVITSEAFLEINQDTLEEILKRETLNIPGGGEVKLFQAVLKWCNHQCSVKDLEATGENRRAVLGDAVNHIRFLSMSQEEFAKNVPKSGLLTANEVMAFLLKFNGAPSSGLTCDLERRKGSSKSCIRFSQQDIMKPSSTRWSYSGGKCDGLLFTVDKPAWFYGIRLFGDANSGEYKVNMFSNNDFDVGGTYTSNYTSERVGICHGFDVMLPKPRKVSPGSSIAFDVAITGPNSYYGRNGKSSVEVDGVTVNFKDNHCHPSNGTDVTKGQIYELIISHFEDEDN